MNLKSYFEQMPKQQRQESLLSLAKAHNRPASTVYKWIQRKNHPVTGNSLSITEKWSGYEVTRFEERPDVFDVDDLSLVLIKKGYEIELKPEL